MTSSGSAMSGLELAAVLAQLGLDVRQAPAPRRPPPRSRRSASSRSRRRGSRARRRGGPRHGPLAQRTLCAWLPVKCWSRFPNVAGVTTRRSTRSPVWATPRAPPPPPRSVIGDDLQGVEGLVTAATSSDATTMSRSLTSSALRRADPATSARTTAGCARSPSRIASADRHRARAARRAPRPAARPAPSSDAISALSSSLRRRTLQLPDRPALAGRAQRLQRVDAELVVQPACALGPEALELVIATSPGRELRPQLLGRRGRAGVEQQRELLLERLADPGQLGRRGPARDERRDRHRRFADTFAALR